MKKTKKIIDISIKLRQNLEEYQSMNKSWTKSLRGACATASFILANELKKNKYEAWMIHATHKSNQYGDHMWVETSEYIIDITYTQFNSNEKIRVMTKGSPEAKKYYKEFINHFYAGNNIDFFSLVKFSKKQDPNTFIKKMKYKI